MEQFGDCGIIHCLSRKINILETKVKSIIGGAVFFTGVPPNLNTVPIYGSTDGQTIKSTGVEIDPITSCMTVPKILTGDGSPAAPSMAFDSQQDTGIYKSSATSLSVTAGGAEKLRVSQTEITPEVKLNMNLNPIENVASSTAVASFYEEYTDAAFGWDPVAGIDDGAGGAITCTVKIVKTGKQVTICVGAFPAGILKATTTPFFDSTTLIPLRFRPLLNGNHVRLLTVAGTDRTVWSEVRTNGVLRVYGAVDRTVNIADNTGITIPNFWYTYTLT